MKTDEWFKEVKEGISKMISLLILKYRGGDSLRQIFYTNF